MNRFVSLCLIFIALVASSVQGFAPSSLGGISGGEYGPFDVRLFQIIGIQRSLPIPFLFLTITITNAMIGSNFVVSQRPRAVQQPVARSNSKTSLQMGSQAKFGIFSPAVYAAKIALGNDKLNKIRGKAISLHSQYIGDFCEWAGAYHLRTRLIKKAKVNGDVLGFLV
jgi:hypothetical protein